MVRLSPSNYFSLFNIEPALSIDLEDLQTKYYELSKKFHPDLHTQGSREEQKNAIENSALLNKAYRTLKDPTERAYYLLDLYPPKTKVEEKIPLELAEVYFEIDDLEGDRILEFKKELETLKSDYEEQWNALSKTLDLNHTETLKSFLIKRKYLSSLMSDIEKRTA